MPKEMFIQAAEVFRKELSEVDNPYVLGYTLKNKLAEFFQVSKQSAGIRMQELEILWSPVPATPSLYFFILKVRYSA